MKNASIGIEKFLSLKTAGFLCLLCAASVSHASDCSVTSVGFMPLYESAFVPRSASREAAALAAVSRIDPDETAVLVSVGMSNTTNEFSFFEPRADSDPLKNRNLIVVDGASDGVTADRWSDPNDVGWNILMNALAAKGVTASQVRVVWMKSANRAENISVPAYLAGLDTDIRETLQVFTTKFPNLELVTVSSRIYAGYASTDLNPEPYAYQTNVVTDNIVNSNLNLPFEVIWGPYLWADGTTARGDGLQWFCSDLASDGTHPSTSGRTKVADMLLDFFRNDSVGRVAYLGLGEPGGDTGISDSGSSSGGAMPITLLALSLMLLLYRMTLLWRRRFG